MWRLLPCFAVLFVSTNAKIFNNPILDNADYPDPGVIKVDGVYYIVTTTNNLEPNKYPIHTSRDLNNWTLSGYVFTQDNFPSWSGTDKEFWAPEIHKIGNEYRVYYTSRNIATDQLSIGVASSTAPGGPYKDLGRALFVDPSGHESIDQTIINDNGTIYFIWKDLTGGWIKALPMNPDGLSFSSDEITDIFRDEYPWEDGTVEGPWYARRGDYHYLYYSGHGYCSDLYRVGIARSRNPLGPYEKRGDPILASNSKFFGPGHNSVVKDLNGQDDVMVFHAFKKDQVCGEWPRLTFLASIGWGEDQWPYVYDWQEK